MVAELHLTPAAHEIPPGIDHVETLRNLLCDAVRQPQPAYDLISIYTRALMSAMLRQAQRLPDGEGGAEGLNINDGGLGGFIDPMDPEYYPNPVVRRARAPRIGGPLMRQDALADATMDALQRMMQPGGADPLAALYRSLPHLPLLFEGAELDQVKEALRADVRQRLKKAQAQPAGDAP